MSLPTSLQRDLADRILLLIRDRALQPGDRVNENSLARELNVSRSPVRGAMDHLAASGIVVRRPRFGFELARPAPAVTDSRPSLSDDDEANELLVRVAHERRLGRLPDDVSETELMRRFAVTRPLLQRTLGQLAESGAIERKPGYGWRFGTSVLDEAARIENYRFRLVLEPQAMLEPGFALDAAWAGRMRAGHDRVLAGHWRRSSSVAFFEMNAAFHEGIAAASGNRFILAAIRRQNQLRRFANYDWSYGTERVVQNCREHLEILDRLEGGDAVIASLLMRRHLEGAMRLRRSGEEFD